MYRVFFLLGHPKNLNNFSQGEAIVLKFFAHKPIFLAEVFAENRVIWTNVAKVMSILIFSLWQKWQHQGFVDNAVAQFENAINGAVSEKNCSENDFSKHLTLS